MHKRNLLLSLLVITGLILSGIYLVNDRESHDVNESQLIQPLPEEQWWDIKTARKIKDESYAFLGGVTHNEKFLLLLKQAFMGDKNALLQVAIIRLEDQDVIDRPDFYGEGSESQVSQFIKKYRKQLVTDEGIPLTEPTLLKNDPWAMIKQMADSGHPESSFHYLWRRIISSIMYRKLTDEERQLGFNYLNNLLDVKRYRRLAHQTYGDFILFDNARGTYYGTVVDPSRLKSVKERRKGLTEAEEAKAIEMYQVCAMDGELACATHLAEAYAYGIGVEKDWVQAYAWARVVNFVHYPFLEEARGDQTSIIASMNKLALAVIKEGDEHLSAAQKLAAQKIANQLIDQISFS